MVLSIERAKVGERMQHVRSLLSFIKAQESDAVPPIDSDLVKIIRGLYFVHLYGAFEKSVNEAVEQYMIAVDELNVRFCDFSIGFIPVALDPKFNSLKSSDRWQGRIDLAKLLESDSICELNTSIFSMQLQNTKSQILKNIAVYIGVDSTSFDIQRDSLYLDEVVEKRNQVAHGRGTPIEIGSAGRSPDLEARLEALNRILESFFVVLEGHFNSLGFVKNQSRANYQI